jgi:hypothetical protein
MDCFSLCLECLERHTDLAVFERVYVLANAPAPDHLHMAMEFAKRHANATVVGFGPRGMASVMEAQTVVLGKHPDSMVVKLDEDVFVTEGWLQGLIRVYAEHGKKGCALVSALVPNNNMGKLMLDDSLRRTFPEYAANAALHENGAVHNPDYAVWLWRMLVEGRLDLTPARLLEGLADAPVTCYLSINCILMDPRMLECALPFGLLTGNATPEMVTDEYKINAVLRMEHVPLYGVMTPRSVAHHFSFGPQQEALDKALSLEAIRDCLLHPRFTRANENRGQSA